MDANEADTTAPLMRALRASRTIAWECDVRSGVVSLLAAAEVLGAALVRSPMRFRHALRFVFAEDRREVIRRIQRAAARCEPFVHHFRIVPRPGAEPVWVESHGDALCDASGEVRTLSGAMIDVTAHRHALEALAAADRRKDEFIATLAHELRNPLNAIGAAAQVLNAPSADAAQLTRCANVIRRQAAHLARLVDDLLDVSRVSRHRLEFRREPTDVGSALTAALEATGELIRSKRHSLHVTLPPEPVDVEADPVRLAQVFGNLLTNAAKYTPEGGDIRVRLEREENWAVVRVRDSGVGISADELSHVFEPFYQANGAQTHARGGLGIGLSLVQRITQLHGGTVEAVSAGPGRGSEFTVRLPAHVERTDYEPPPRDGASVRVTL